MEFSDPFSPKLQPKNKILFAASQLQGDRDTQEDYFTNFREECFVLADGVGGMPHGEVAAQLGAETAVWGYKHIRQRRFYWAGKELFIKRIFRSANIAVWQKQREAGFSDGLATTLLVVILGTRLLWLGSVGDSSIFLFRPKSLQKLTRADVDENGLLTKVVGTERYGLIPQFTTEKFHSGDSLALLTDGVGNFVSEEEIGSIVASAGTTTPSLSQAVTTLLQTAEKNGSRDNMTACLIKRVAIS